MTRFPVGWHPRRGEIYLVRLDKDRPALIISSDLLNRHALDVCIVPITSIRHMRFALRVAIPAGEGGLNRDSWAKCDQVTTLDKQDVFFPPLGRVAPATLTRIEEGIRLALEI